MSAALKTNPPPWAHLLAGATSRLVTSLLTSPLDILRTQLQSGQYRLSSNHANLASPHRSQTLFLVSSIYHHEGWRGFFHGLTPSLLGVVPATAIKFYVYGNCKRLTVAAGIATATATNPIWLVKTRMQIIALQPPGGQHSPRHYNSALGCVQQILRQEGLSASYLGTVETMVHLVVYEEFKQFYQQALAGVDPRDGMAWHALIGIGGAAGSAKLVAGLITYPHEVLRTRLRQAPLKDGTKKYVGLLQCFRLIRAEEGFVALYSGLTPHLICSIPSALITLSIYESVLKLVGHNHKS
ncbi:mitochondrial carrier [Pleurotus eryngii]|uniref:Mitochondrial carrier n=1 Tax=Pleurotus eryngii TaxID=5323 RepID=A0A9P5ZX46_PLEER|nr:mitochondrial carrier [Pleurotus eryngii]